MAIKKGTKIPANANNKSAQKLTTDELKKEAYRQYCEYIATGKSKEGWVFIHPDMSLTNKTIEKYIRESPTDFPPLQKELAESLSFQQWESRGTSMMTDKGVKSEPALYQMFMRNKFGWDKQKIEVTTIRTAADDILDRMNEPSK